jgi:lipopolysaccharide transport system permease protein
VAIYKQTILGPLWYIIQPLFTTLVFTVVFGNIAQLPTGGLPPFFFTFPEWFMEVFCGLSTCTSSTFVSNAHIFGKVYFPRDSSGVCGYQ